MKIMNTVYFHCPYEAKNSENRHEENDITQYFVDVVFHSIKLENRLADRRKSSHGQRLL